MQDLFLGSAAMQFGSLLSRMMLVLLRLLLLLRKLLLGRLLP